MVDAPVEAAEELIGAESEVHAGTDAGTGGRGIRRIELTRGVARAAALALVLLVVGACGGGEGGDEARPTISPTRTPTATLSKPTLPSPTRSTDRSDRPELPSPTRSPERTDIPEPSPTRSPERTDSPEPSPTRSPERTDSPESSPTRSPGRTDEPEEQTSEKTSTEAEPKLEPPTQPTSEPTTADPSETAADAAAEDEGLPSWMWWLGAAVLAAAAVGIPLWVRARRRGAWREQLASAESEVVWFARELLPQLRHVDSVEQVTGGWAVGQARVAAAEDRLTALESTAPEDAARERARILRDAVRLARGRLQELSGPEPHATWEQDLDEIITDLEVVLGGPPVTPPADHTDENDGRHPAP